MLKLAVAGICGRMGRAVTELAAGDDRFDVVAGLTVPGDPMIGSSIPFRGSGIRVSDRLSAEDRSDELALRPCDVLIDFSVADGTMAWLEVCERRQVPMVIGATGHSDAQLGRIREAAHNTPIVKGTNFSPGIQAIVNALERLLPELGDGYDVEIVETHHRHKVDAPSGTALSLLETIRSAVEAAARRRRAASGGGVPAGEPDAGSLNPADVGRAREPSAGGRPGAAAAGAAPEVRPVFGRRGRTGERRPGEIGIHSVRMGDHVGRHEIHLSGPGETVTLVHTAHSRETFAAGALRAAAWIVSRPPGFYTMREVLGS